MYHIFNIYAKNVGKAASTDIFNVINLKRSIWKIKSIIDGSEKITNISRNGNNFFS